jgi:hypothetical protein
MDSMGTVVLVNSVLPTSKLVYKILPGNHLAEIGGKDGSFLSSVRVKDIMVCKISQNRTYHLKLDSHETIFCRGTKEKARVYQKEYHASLSDEQKEEARVYQKK